MHVRGGVDGGKYEVLSDAQKGRKDGDKKMINMECRCELERKKSVRDW